MLSRRLERWGKSRARPRLRASWVPEETTVNALEKVIDGFRRFRDDALQTRPEFFEKLARQQTPKVMVIGCCDSRVDGGEDRVEGVEDEGVGVHE